MNKKQSLVSIILPVYNAEKFVEETINSILNQTYSNIELIIVEDCSTDNSLNIIKKFSDKRIKVFNFKENKGVAIARNYGVDKSEGEYLAFIDSDDIWKKDKLEKQMDFLQKNTQCNFVFSSYELINESGKKRNQIIYSQKEVDYKFILRNTIISTPTVLLKKSGFTDISFENISTAEDYSLWYKLLRDGEIAYGIKEPLVLVRKRSKSLSKNRLKVIYNLYKVQRRYEKQNIFQAFINICFYIVNALRKRKKH